MAIDLDDPIALMLAASSAFARAGIEAAAHGGLTLGAALSAEITDHDILVRFARLTTQG